MLNVNNFKIAKLLDKLDKEDYTRPVPVIHVTPSATQATDRHVAIEVKAPVQQGLFPEVLGEKATENFKPFRMAREDALRLCKEIPAGPKVRENPVMGCIEVSENKADVNCVNILCKDDKHSKIIRFDKQPGHYPDISRVIPPLKSTEFEVGFNATLLANLLKCIEGVSGRNTTIVMRFSGNEKALRIDTVNQLPAKQGVTALIMPVRPSD